MIWLTLFACKTSPNSSADAVQAPSVEVLFQTFLDKTALPEHDSRYMAGTMSVPAQGLEGPMEIWQTREGNKMLMRSEIPGIGEMWQGWDGQTGWADDPVMGPRVLEGGELDGFLFGASFDGDADWRERYSELEVKGLDSDWATGPAWEVKGQIPALDTPITLWFDQESGLLVGTQFKVPSGMGKLKTTSVIEDYIEMEGLGLVATTTRTQVLAMEQILTFHTFELDVEALPDFGPPESVRSLME